MSKMLAASLALSFSLSTLPPSGNAQDSLPDIEVVATVRVQVSAGSMEEFRKLVADFARRHGFGRGQESTMPRHRKVFLVAGAFSTTFASKRDDYLLVHNIVGKDCVLVDLYAVRDRPAFKGLMAELGQTIDKTMAGEARVVGGNLCRARKTAVRRSFHLVRVQKMSRARQVDFTRQSPYPPLRCPAVH